MYASVRAAVPKDRLLEYRLESGWGPQDLLVAFWMDDVQKDFLIKE
jgi:hypothetical protein